MKIVKTRRFLTTGLLFVTGLLLASCGGDRGPASGTTGGKPEGTITISGAFALYPLTNVWAEAFHKEYPGIRFNISGGGAGKGMADVLAGAADLAMYSKEISDIEIRKGAYGFAVTKDAVLPTISAQNPLLSRIQQEGLSREVLSAYFLGNGEKKWKQTDQEVHVYTRSDAAGAASVWAQYLGNAPQESLKGIAVFGDPGLADAVKKDPLGIGYNNVIYIYDINSGKKYPGMEVAPIDINADGKIDSGENFYHSLKEITAAIADGRYPSPPARELYLVSKGKPASEAVTIFLNWVLTKGQDYVVESGYIRLDTAVIAAQRRKL